MTRAASFTKFSGSSRPVVHRERLVVDADVSAIQFK